VVASATAAGDVAFATASSAAERLGTADHVGSSV
jgi:hypothetical protein